MLIPVCRPSLSTFNFTLRDAEICCFTAGRAPTFQLHPFSSKLGVCIFSPPPPAPNLLPRLFLQPPVSPFLRPYVFTLLHLRIISVGGGGSFKDTSRIQNLESIPIWDCTPALHFASCMTSDKSANLTTHQITQGRRMNLTITEVSSNSQVLNI